MIKKIILLGTVLFLISACSDDESAKSEKELTGDHVWKEQTQAIDRAKEVEGMLQDAADEQRKVIDEQVE
jgi:outer membrane biogenesis lipoprotein LolB